MQAVLITFDSLAANSLGCYGNDWIETPHWDRFAAAGAVFDRHFTTTVGTQAAIAWLAAKQSDSAASAASVLNLGRKLKSHGIAARLVSSVRDFAGQLGPDFESTQIVQGREDVEAKPDEVPFAQVVKAGLDTWNDPTLRAGSRLLWLHSAGPGQPPQGFDSLYFEDFEERGVSLAELSDQQRSEHPAVYGGAVSLLDHWLGELLTGIADTAEPTLVIATAGQGHSWQRIQPSKSAAPGKLRPTIDDQLIRTPLVLKVIGDDRFADIKSLRSDRLVQTSDLAPTLLDWFKIDTDTKESLQIGQSWLRELTEEVQGRDWLHIRSDAGTEVVRTADWLCIREQTSRQDDEFASETVASDVSLFVKPEDLWDVNDVSSQQPEIVTDLLGRIPHRG